MLYQILLGAVFVASAVQAVDIALVAERSCSGQVLFGRPNISEVQCHSLQQYTTFQSVALSKFEADQVVHFFADNACQDSIHHAADQECFTPHSPIGSLSIQAPATNKASENYTTDFSAGSDIALRLSNYQGTNVTDPFAIYLSNSIVTVAGHALVLAGSGYTFGSAIYNCYVSVRDNGAQGIASNECLGVAVGSVVAFSGHYITARGDPRLGQRINERLQGATGTISNVKRGDLPELEWFDQLHSRDTSSGTFKHVGILERGFAAGPQASPILELDGHNGTKWHLAAFMNPGSGGVFYLHSAEETEIAAHSQAVQTYGKRSSAPYGYDTVRWSQGGMDFAICGYNADEPASGYTGSSLPSLYNTVYDQLHCQLAGADLESANGLLVDLYNLNSVLKGSVTMQPYVGSNQVSVKCSTDTADINQSCVIN